jgi:hypothetical protein
MMLNVLRNPCQRAFLVLLIASMILLAGLMVVPLPLKRWVVSDWKEATEVDGTRRLSRFDVACGTAILGEPFSIALSIVRAKVDSDGAKGDYLDNPALINLATAFDLDSTELNSVNAAVDRGSLHCVRTHCTRAFSKPNWVAINAKCVTPVWEKEIHTAHERWQWAERWSSLEPWSWMLTAVIAVSALMSVLYGLLVAPLIRWIRSG